MQNRLANIPIDEEYLLYLACNLGFLVIGEVTIWLTFLTIKYSTLM